ncbi:Ecdysteroid-regulated 16 kDa protein [Gryllus bimaculatus]|nr:Ecdysteroid-regulated 16 kDa protein [Gryllus bimaculatus]
MGSSKAVITSADVEDCPGNVCKLKKGTNATLHLSFKTEDVVEDLSVRLYGILLNHTMPYPGHYQKDGCQSDGVSCPVQPDTIQNYTLIIPVRKNFPKVPSVTIKLEINDIICIHIPGQVA